MFRPWFGKGCGGGCPDFTCVSVRLNEEAARLCSDESIVLRAEVMSSLLVAMEHCIFLPDIAARFFRLLRPRVFSPYINWSYLLVVTVVI